MSVDLFVPLRGGCGLHVRLKNVSFIYYNLESILAQSVVCQEKGAKILERGGTPRRHLSLDNICYFYLPRVTEPGIHSHGEHWSHLKGNSTFNPCFHNPFPKHTHVFCQRPRYFYLARHTEGQHLKRTSHIKRKVRPAKK